MEAEDGRYSNRRSVGLLWPRARGSEQIIETVSIRNVVGVQRNPNLQLTGIS